LGARRGRFGENRRGARVFVLLCLIPSSSSSLRPTLSRSQSSNAQHKHTPDTFKREFAAIHHERHAPHLPACLERLDSSRRDKGARLAPPRNRQQRKQAALFLRAAQLVSEPPAPRLTRGLYCEGQTQRPPNRTRRAAPSSHKWGRGTDKFGNRRGGGVPRPPLPFLAAARPSRRALLRGAAARGALRASARDRGAARPRGAPAARFLRARRTASQKGRGDLPLELRSRTPRSRALFCPRTAQQIPAPRRAQPPETSPFAHAHTDRPCEPPRPPKKLTRNTRSQQGAKKPLPSRPPPPPPSARALTPPPPAAGRRSRPSLGPGEL
jgi:hypothetical protein